MNVSHKAHTERADTKKPASGCHPNRLICLQNMARSGGFEPPTAWFVARYSIQLSYERVLC